VHPLLFSEVHDHLFCFVDVEGEFVFQAHTPRALTSSM
jgi:hypothetical protein